MQYLRVSRTVPLFENFCRKNQIDGKQIIADIGGRKVKLKVASKDETKAKGLMHSDEPEENEGMLFIYDIDEPLTFWMKNVNFPLDILFFDSDLNLLDNLTMDPDDGSPDEDLPKYSSKGPCRFAVELKSGWGDRNLKNKKCKLSF